MPTPLSHAFFGAAAAGVFAPGRNTLRFLVAGGICGLLPDLDVVALRLGVPYDHLLGHRGLTHSLFFALVVSAAAVSLGFGNVRFLSRRWWGLSLLFFAITALHGVLDAMTSGGLGVAFFSPFDQGRHFLPWRPIAVSPIGLRRFISRWGLRVIISEMTWVWIPMILPFLAARGLRALWSGRKPARAEVD